MSEVPPLLFLFEQALAWTAVMIRAQKIGERRFISCLMDGRGGFFDEMSEAPQIGARVCATCATDTPRAIGG